MSNISILDTINETMHLNRLQGATYEKVKNSFFANYLAALVLLRLQDLKGLMIINDPLHSKLTKFSDNMSDVNFWGRAMFYPNEHEIKSRIETGHEKILAKDAIKVLDARIQKMMKVPMTSPDQVNWDEAVGSLLLLKHRFGLNSSYFNNITTTIHKWNSISDAAKKRTINQVFMYLMQSDPDSKILERIRSIAGSTMVGGLNNVAQRIIGFKKLSEDEGGGGDATSVGGIASTSGVNAIVNGKGAASTGSNSDSPDMQNVLAGLYKLKKKAPLQVTKKSGVVFKDGKIIKRKVKTFVARKFKAPDYLKVVKKQGDK